jgi:hypothetical protein
VDVVGYKQMMKAIWSNHESQETKCIEGGFGRRGRSSLYASGPFFFDSQAAAGLTVYMRAENIDSAYIERWIDRARREKTDASALQRATAGASRASVKTLRLSSSALVPSYRSHRLTLIRHGKV